MPIKSVFRNSDVFTKEHKLEAQCAQKWRWILFFVICGFIEDFLSNSYFVLQIYHVKSFNMMHVTSMYFDFSLRYSWKCIKKLILLRLLSNYYPDRFFVICGFIKNFIPNPYFIFQIFHEKSFKMRHVMFLYFNFSVRYS